MARAKITKREKPDITVTTVALTPVEVKVLRRLSSDMSDVIGRRVSVSQVLRALVRWVDNTQEPQVVRDQIVPLIEKELSLLRWGGKKET